MNLEGLTEKRNRMGTIYYENNVGEIVRKHCSKCGDIKKLEDFSKHKSGLGGRNSECKECNSKRLKKWYKENPDYLSNYYKDNRESQLEKNREWREANKEYRTEYRRNWYEENTEYVREYCEQNRDKRNEYGREWYERNRETKAEYRRKWQCENPEKLKIYSNRRRARKAALANDLTPEQYAITLDYFGNACALTGCNINIEMEHALPLVIGHGGTTFGNCYPMANGLNQSKGNKNIFEWFEANRQRFNLEQERFDRLIEWLGKANGMTVDEYREYVYWCHANPREVDEIDTQNGENRHAI
jgi:hypothetical protein